MVHGSYDEARRAELAGFLKARRARVTPEQVGLAPGPRRRTPGLRREEVAQLAGVGVTWYTWLEQGRPINASTQVLDAVARVLGLGSAELWHLYRLAEVPGVPMPPPTRRPLPSDVMPVLDALGPNPACVYDGKFDLLACNEPYAALFPALARASGIQRNALFQIFTTPPDLDPLCDWDLVPRMVAIARGNYAKHVGEPGWTEWIDQLSSASERFAQMWAKHDVAESTPMIKSFRAFDLGRVETRTTSFSVSGLPESRMVVYLPLTAADAAKIATLVGRARKRSAQSA